MGANDKPLSSYQKGINRLLQHQEKFERLILEYLLSVNSKYNSNMFPTPQVAKVLLSKLKMKKTQFPILHKIVRTIIGEWQEHGWCKFVSTSRSTKNRRTKSVYSFTPENIQFLKGRYISSSISKIEDEIQADPNVSVDNTMKTREVIMDDWEYKIREMLDDINVDEADEEDREDDEKNE